MQKSKGTYGHIGSSANKGIRHGVNELATDSKVAEFNLSPGIHQDI